MSEAGLSYGITVREPFLFVMFSGTFSKESGDVVDKAKAEILASAAACVVFVMRDVWKVARSGFPSFIQLQTAVRDKGKWFRVCELREELIEDLIKIGAVRREEASKTIATSLKELQETLDRQQGYPILIVDDEKLAQEYISHILRDERLQALSADSAEAAWELLTKRTTNLGAPHISCIISDWKLTGADGVELLAKLRESAIMRHIPFILMSGALDQKELEAASRNRANAVILKPIDRAMLMMKIRAATGRI